MSPSSSSSSAAVTTATSTGTSLAIVPAPGSCPHEIRPGTTICLHCRKDERLARLARRRRTIARVGAAVVGVAVCAVVANAAAGAFDLRLLSLAELSSALTPSSPAAGDAHAPAAGHRVAPGSASASARDAAAAPESAAPVYGATDGATTAAVGAVGAATTGTLGADAARPAIAAVVAEGRTVLRGGDAVAVRAGDVVTVQFDTPDLRTRRADKFESIVRATLPAVYGAVADSALAHVAAGALVKAEELVTELPARGVRLAVPGGALVLWPETRPGRDGPLVVSYRTVVAR